LTLGRKLYAVAGLLAVLAIALAANAVVPLAKATGEVGNARRDVAAAVAAEATGRHSAEWFWHLGTMPLMGMDADRSHVDFCYELTQTASRDWIRSERGDDDIANVQTLRRTFLDIVRQGDRVIDAVRTGDQEAASRILVNQVFIPSTESYALPLDRAVRRQDSEMREALVRLAGATGAAGPVASDHLTSHVLDARTRSELSLAASSFIRFRLLHAQILTGAVLDPREADPAFTSVMDLVARNEMDVWTAVASESGATSAIASIAKIRAADGRASALATAVTQHLQAGRIAAARRLFAEGFAPAIDVEIGAVDAAIAADERLIESAMTTVVDEHRRIASLMMLVALLALALAFVSALAARRLARRLASTTAAVRSFAGGEYVPVEVHGHDEISELCAAFNAMSIDVRKARDQEKRFVQRTVEATESERMQLAAELHDGPIQRLTGLLYGLERAGARIERGKVDGVEEFLRDARAKVSAEVGALRHLLSELRPPVLEERGLGVAIRDYLSELARRDGIVCDVDVRLEERLSESLETTIYRILQEALANVTKHARADRVAVSLWRDDDSVHLRVIDNGCGFEPDARTEWGGDHFGMTGMIGRAQYAGGSLEIASTAGEGTVVSATFPIVPERPPFVVTPERVAS
jgi:signal transduction histidine kinase